MFYRTVDLKMASGKNVKIVTALLSLFKDILKCVGRRLMEKVKEESNRILYKMRMKRSFKFSLV
jgi:hypothetical protein